MKKAFIISGMVLAGALFLTSCTKNLKNDIRNLQQQADSLEKRNSELQQQADSVEIILGSNEPLMATTTFTDDNGAIRTVAKTYRFKTADSESQRLVKKENGLYEINIKRYSSVGGDNQTWMRFTYNPITKAITNQDYYHTWTDSDPYNNAARYVENEGPAGSVAFTVNIKNINLVTGDISLVVTASATSAYTSYTWQYYTPNPGQPMSTTFTFTGKLKVFATN